MFKGEISSLFCLSRDLWKSLWSWPVSVEVSPSSTVINSQDGWIVVSRRPQSSQRSGDISRPEDIRVEHPQKSEDSFELSLPVGIN